MMMMTNQKKMEEEEEEADENIDVQNVQIDHKDNIQLGQMMMMMMMRTTLRRRSRVWGKSIACKQGDVGNFCIDI